MKRLALILMVSILTGCAAQPMHECAPGGHQWKMVFNVWSGVAYEYAKCDE